MKKIDVTQPYAMSSPFADGVYSSVSTSDFEIPADTSTAPDDTCVIDDGFLPITSTDLDDGGIAPERKNFNGMFYLSTDQRFFLQNGGFITYNSNVATAIGGYPQDAILSFINSQGTYKLVKSLIDDNTNDFTQDETLIDGEHWEEIEMGGGGSGYQMFDIVMKDHVLDYAETLGLAPLGTYVYKEAIAGTRYGYPSFYQKCVDEYNDGTSAYMSSNINIVGSLTDNDGVLSGFTTSTNYATSLMPNYFPTSANSWELVIKAKMGSTPTGNVGFSSISYKSLNLYIPANSNNVTVELSSNNSTFDIGSIASTGLQTNTYYWFKVEFTGTAYNYYVSTDGTTYTLQGTITSSTSIYLNDSGIILGADYNLNAGGDVIIDLNETYLNVNGSRFWTGTNTCIQSTNKHRFYDIADKATFDNMFAITGEAWYYGIDTTNERIFLPRSTRFKNGTTSDVGGYQPAGLPNITGKVLVPQASDQADGESLYADGAGLSWGINGNAGQRIIHIDASRSSSIYGASDTVEYSSTKLIPYMVVGNQSTWSGMTDVVNQGMTILSQVNAGLATKLDLDLTNITNSTKSTIAGYAMPSSTYKTYTLGASGMTITAPANGFFRFGGVSGGLSFYQIKNLSTTLVDGDVTPTNGYVFDLTVECRKNDTIEVLYQIAPYDVDLRFVYAQGSESEAS